MCNISEHYDVPVGNIYIYSFGGNEYGKKKKLWKADTLFFSFLCVGMNNRERKGGGCKKKKRMSLVAASVTYEPLWRCHTVSVTIGWV